jgi:uncharacterized DUF497 family protein
VGQRQKQEERRRPRHQLQGGAAGLQCERAITTEDYIDENSEMRYQTLGLIEGVLIVVAHVDRVFDGIEQPSYIMARKAVKYEEKQYFSRRRR